MTMALRIAVKHPLKKLKILKRLMPFGKPSIAVTRKAIRYMEKTGWKLSTSTTPSEWHGYYRTRFGSYKGKISTTTPPQFFIYKPPAGLKAHHSHRSCFHAMADKNWYAAHFSIIPKDLDSGVIKLERILCEAFLLTQKPA